MRFRARVWVVTVVAIVVVLGALAVSARLFWPKVRLSTTDASLAHFELAFFAGHVGAVEVTSASNDPVAVTLRQGNLWPLHKIAANERLTLTVTVRRPSWAAWLVGHTERRVFSLVTPAAHLAGRWLQVASGSEVSVAFDTSVAVVSLQGSHTRLAVPRAVVPLGVIAGSTDSAGSVLVAAAARSWERLSAPVRVNWFLARPYPQVLVDPSPSAKLAPAGRLTLTFSEPVADVLGLARPTVHPATAGQWRLTDAHTLTFQPTGFGFALGERLRVTLPAAVHLAGQSGARLTHSLTWQVPQGSTLRVQQLLAELGYLPFNWQARRADPQSVASQLVAAISPPAGVFSWRYAQLHSLLGSLWQPGTDTVLVRGAVMAFESDHGLASDGVAGSRVWIELLQAALHHQVDRQPYDYVSVSTSLPETLRVWRDGRVVFTSLTNTGIVARPTALGTFPVFARYLTTTMSGTNADGSHYSDPGVPYVAYFNGGDAVHGYSRAGYGYPQSLGCVELPYAAARVVFGYDPIGTLVRVY